MIQIVDKKDASWRYMDTNEDLGFLLDRSYSSHSPAELIERIGLYESVLDSIQNGAIITDAAGYVLYLNKPYGEFLGVDPAEQIGRHATEVVENSRMHIVGQTGKPEIHVAQKIHGKEMVVQLCRYGKTGRWLPYTAGSL